MATNELDELLNETQRRQRLKTDLSEFSDQLKEMMRLNISLPVILEWLEKQKKTTTLPALRRYVKRVFGDEHYEDFVRRNGWHKTKKLKELDNAPASPDVLGPNRRSEDVALQEVGAVVKVESEKKEAEENDNPLIANGIGTSLQKVASKPKVKLTFENRNKNL